MSSRVRVRSRGGGYLNSRGAFGSGSDYKMPSNFSTKTREEKHSEDRRRDRSLDKRKGEDNRKGDHHRESSKSNGRHKDYKESFSSSRENRDSFMTSKDVREPFSSRGDRDSYSSRDTDAFSSRDREPYSSRGDHDSFSSRGRDSYSSRGGRISYSSRGGFDQFSSRGNRESYANRGGRILFSSRGNHETYSSRGGREQFSSRGRDSFSSRGNRDQFSLRGGRESFSSRGRDSYLSRGKDSYSTRGGRESFSARGGREYFPTRGFGRGMFRGSLRGSRSGNSFLGHRTQLEMTKKLVASVLNTDESMGDRISYRSREDKSHSFSGRVFKDARRYFGQDVERRSFKAPRAERSWSQDERPLKRENLSTKFKNEHLYSSKMDKYGGIRKRVAEIDEPEPSSKRLRLNEVGRFRGMMQKRFCESSHDKHELTSESDDDGHSRKVSRDKLKELMESPSEKTKVSKKRTTSSSKHSKERSRSGSASPQEVKVKRKRRESEKGKAKEDKETKDRPKEELEEEAIRLKIEDEPKKEASGKFSSDEEESPHEKKKKKKDRTPSGMQVTIRSDGERAVNNDGHVKSRLSCGKVFVDLRCPHCPGHTSVTFQEYRFHLETRRHNYFLNDLANKHSVVLRRIRLQQRNEQREMEEKIEKENPEEFASFVSRYCRNCKLAFKVNAEDIQEGYAEHNSSKLHKIQKAYLYPRCVMCRMSFPSRMVYEYHIASIRHLRVKTITLENSGKETLGQTEGDDEEDFATEEDLANFVTMDSVGEDEEIGSEHDEITGNIEDIEAAEQEAKADDEEEGDDDDEYDAEENLDEDDCGTLRRRAILEEEDPIELDVANESEHLEDLKDVEVLGKDYICVIEASYCKLCNKVIRTDSSIGIEAIDHHCRTSCHLENYHYLQSEDFMDEHGEGFEEANRLEEDYLADEDEEGIDEGIMKDREVIEELHDLVEKELKDDDDSIDNVDDDDGILNISGTERQSNEEIIKEEKKIKESNKEERTKEEEVIDSLVEPKDEIAPENILEEVGEQLEEIDVKNKREKTKQDKSLKEEDKAKESGRTKKPVKLTRRKTIPTKLSSKT